MSYPFDHFRSWNWQCDSRTVYVLFPFEGDGASFTESVVKRAVSQSKLNYKDAKSKVGPSGIVTDILSGIAAAELVIGVLIGSNPNVFWEIGLAMSWKPATQVLTIGRKKSADEQIPFNLSGYRHLLIDTAVTEDEQILQLAAAIAEIRDSHETLLERSVESARNSLGPAELKIMERWGAGSHFYLPAHHAISIDEDYMQPLTTKVDEFRNEVHSVGPKLLATQIDGMATGNLCRLGLLACSTAMKDEDGTNRFEYSFYWSPLGNRVLEKLGFILPGIAQRRFDELPPEIRTWGPGHVLSAPLP